MNTPIIDPSTLTEEQKQAIRLYYSEAEDFIESVYPFIVAYGYGEKMLLERLFGKEFFEKRE